MQSNKSRDTRVEVQLRSALHRSGLRFRKNVRPIPGLRCTADVVFPRQRVAVFADGCFWHSCPKHGSAPKTNAEWWAAKLSATVARDAASRSALERVGWTVVRVWEHDDVASAVTVVVRALEAAPRQT